MKDSAYCKVWLESLRRRPPSEPWHIVVLQTQFIDGGFRRIGESVGQPHYDQTLHDEMTLIERAAEIIVAHGYTPTLGGIPCT